jgi:hypothetical protein
MTIDAELKAQRHLLRSHLTSARKSIDVIRTTLAKLRASPNADAKDQGQLDAQLETLDAAAAPLKSIENELAALGPDSDTSRER